MAGKKKSIKLLLNDGDLDGVVLIEDSSWQSGAMYAAPRDAVDKLLLYKECSYSGVYFLLSDDKVYVGQAGDLKARIKQHIAGKNWWKQVVLLTTNNDSFTHTAIDYIEAYFIDLAQKYHHLDVDNKKGEKAKVSKFDQIQLDDYIEEAIFLLERIMGIYVFSNKVPIIQPLIKNPVNSGNINSNTLAGSSILSKSEALNFMAQIGVVLKSNECTYAKSQPTKYWANPKKEVTQSDWNIILNDMSTRELIHIFIPANTFQVGSDKNIHKLVVRKDKPDVLDLNIYKVNLVDMYSKIDFSSFVVNRYTY